jgi:hypothetical protein
MLTPRRTLSRNTLLAGLLAALCLLNVSGCLPLNASETADSGHAQPVASNLAEFEPYYPADFRDLKIPGELIWNMEKSVVLNTNSFKGGSLNFSGRVEVLSLIEFFANSMKNDGWVSVGSIKSKDVLLAFTKANSSCMIRIMEGGPIGKTEVNIYIANSNSN